MTDDRPLTAEQALGAAILHQAYRDLHGSGRVREEAQAFWADREGLAWWDDLLGLEGTLVRRCQPGRVLPS